VADSKKNKQNTKSTKKNLYDNPDKPLTLREQAFCREYIKKPNGKQAATKAGYAPRTAAITASKLLTHANIKKKIGQLTEKRDMKAIADGAEVMEYLTRVMRGEINDQFGLEASLNERTKAAQELAKRTVDIDKKIELNKQGVVDNQINIKLDWSR
jgi:phage terminase small subunit